MRDISEALPPNLYEYAKIYKEYPELLFFEMYQEFPASEIKGGRGRERAIRQMRRLYQGEIHEIDLAD